MNYTFSDNISSVKPSAIREILKMVAANPSIISLSTGSPSNEAIPVEEIHEIAEKIFRERALQSLQYSVTEGYGPLREITAKRLHDVFGIDTEQNDVIITTGGQQGLYMTPEVLINRGDTVIVESPSFVSGIIAMKSNGANVVGIEMDDEGIRMDLLEEAVRTQKNVKLLYLIPTFQNPRGSTMSLQRRKDVYELCKKHGIIILEDNPYGELRFRGEDVPTIKSMDTEGALRRHAHRLHLRSQAHHPEAHHRQAGRRLPHQYLLPDGLRRVLPPLRRARAHREDPRHLPRQVRLHARLPRQVRRQARHLDPPRRRSVPLVLAPRWL